MNLYPLCWGESRSLRIMGRSLPFPPLPFLFLFLPFPLPYVLEVGPLKPAKGSGKRCSKLPTGVRDGAPAENEFGAL